MSTLTAVINQIKESSDSIEENESIYLNEIFDAINDSFKSLGATLEIGFALVSNSMTGSIQKLETEESIQDAKIFEDINESIKELKDVISKQKLKTETDIKSVPSETVNSNKAIVMASKDTTAAIKETTESLKETASNTSSETVIAPNSIEELKVALSDQKIKVDIDNITSDISVSLKELNNGEQLSEEFERLRTTLDTSSVESREIALEQLEAFSNLTIDAGKSEKSQEDIRESNTVTGKMAAAMTNLNDGVSKLGEGLGQIAGGAAKGIGIAGLIMLFVAPEMAMEILDEVMKVFAQGITAITDLFSGSTEGLEDFVKDNPLVSAVLAIAGVIAAIMGVASAITSVMAGIAAVKAAILVITSTFGMGLAPLIAIGAAIGLAIYSLVKSFKDALAVFQETGSISETLKTFFSSFIANFVGTILNLAKGLISWIAGALGFDGVEKFLDGIDFVTGIKKTLGGIFDIVGAYVGILISPIKAIFNLVSKLFDGIARVFGGIIDVVKGIFTLDFGLIMDGLSNIFGGLIDILLSPFIALKDWVVDLAMNIKDALLGFISALNPFNWFSDTKKETAEKLKQKNEDLQKETDPDKRAKIQEEINTMENVSSGFLTEEWGDDAIDRSKIGEASTPSLISLAASGNLNDEDTAFVREEIAKRVAVSAEVTSEPEAYSFPEQKDVEQPDILNDIFKEDTVSSKPNITKRDSFFESSTAAEELEQEAKIEAEILKMDSESAKEFTNNNFSDTSSKKTLWDTASSKKTLWDTASSKKTLWEDTPKSANEAPKVEMLDQSAMNPSSWFEDTGDTEDNVKTSSIMSMMPDPLGISEMLFGGDTSSIMSMMPDPLGLKEMFGGDTSSIISMMPDPLGLKEMFDQSAMNPSSWFEDTEDNVETSSIMSMMPDPLGLKEMFGGDSETGDSGGVITKIGDLVKNNPKQLTTNISEMFGLGEGSTEMVGSAVDTVSNFFSDDDEISKNAPVELTSKISKMFGLGEGSTEMLGGFISNLFPGDMVSPNLESDKPVSTLRDAQIANNQLSDMDKQSGTDAVVSAINTSAVNNTSSNNTTIVNNNNRGIDDLIRSMAYSPAY
jgi:hypothetical protein